MTCCTKISDGAVKGRAVIRSGLTRIIVERSERCAAATLAAASTASAFQCKKCVAGSFNFADRVLLFAPPELRRDGDMGNSERGRGG
jgi:hypothetical protein